MCPIRHAITRRGKYLTPPKFFDHQFLVLSETGVGEVACNKNEVVGRGHELFWCLQDFPGVVKVKGYLYLVVNGLKQLVNVVQSVHSCHVKF